MSWLSDIRTLYALTLAPVRGQEHASRLESFYGRQARDYDAFRGRLLHGRRALVRALPMPAGGTWIDVGGGTGWNLESLGPDIHRLAKVVLVDLCRPLLDVARQRIARHGWPHVHLVRADATGPVVTPGSADVVTFSYALTMIPDWFAALDRAAEAIKPGGYVGGVDFYVSRRYPAHGLRAHNWLTRHGWPAWFDRDGVRPSADHVPYLQSRFDTEALTERVSTVPCLPGIKVPYYIFLGRRRP